MTDRSVPTSTYRLQLHAGFGFACAAEIVPYLARLGISHLYLSPVLQAAPGSMHGYDVVDHSTVSVDLGGRQGLVRLADTAHEHGLGIVVDIVPNHMAIPVPASLNPQLWDTLRHGRDSAYAHWFDVDWTHGEGRLALPVLGGPLDEALADGALSFGEHGGERVISYGDQTFPIAPGTESATVAETLTKQHYALADWREQPEILNYRRFFDVDSLIAVRVELPDVFDATHATLLDLRQHGVIDGFRIDHPDGLADPQGYLERLRDRTDGAWVVVEKILVPGESLPTSWPTAGTTGYDAIRAIQTSMVPAVGRDLDARWQGIGGEPSYERAELESKRLVVADLFQGEVRRLSRAAVDAATATGQRLTAADALAAIDELLAHVERYRAYLRLDDPADDEALEQLGQMARQSTRARPDLADAIAIVIALVADTTSADPAVRDLVVRFQQVCGPVMAKGVEDTTFYRWHRMVALNEVGGDPKALDTADVAALHDWAAAQARHHPLGMTTLSTHDTKRNEDVRARQLAIADDLAGWDEVALSVREAATDCDVDGTTAYLLAQTLLGCWPIDVERLAGYMEKAVREAKLFTTWSRPDQDYEARVRRLVDSCCTGPVATVVERVTSRNAGAAGHVDVATKLLQLTLPGVPDVYQGTEIVSPALVDPDNRRPVDFAVRDTLLTELDDHGPRLDEADAEKLWVTSRALRLRRDRPDLFEASASYQPVITRSPHLLGFVRGGRVATLVARWPATVERTGWGDASLDLPPGEWVDVLSGVRHRVGGALLRCDQVFRRRPAALLVLEGE